MKHLLVMLIMLAIAVPAFAQEQYTLIIGVVTPPESVGGASVDAIFQGVELAVRSLNEAGGIEAQNGRNYRLRILTEEAANANAAAAAVERLTASGAAALIGFPNNGMIPLTLPDNAAPVFVMSSGGDGSLWGTSPLMMGVRAQDAVLAKAAVRFAVEELDAISLTTVVARADYGYAAENGARETIESEDVELALTLDHDPQTSDFSDIAKQIAEQDPDAVIMWNSPAALQASLLALEAENWRGDVIYGYPDGALEVVIPEGIDLYGVTPWAVNDDDDDFTDQYVDEYGANPSPYSAIAYDAVYLITAAVESVGAEHDDVIAWLTSSADYVGVQGEYMPRSEKGELIRAAVVVEITAQGISEVGQYDLNGDSTSDSGGSTPASDDVIVLNTSAGLNLRAQPNAEAAVLLVIPADVELNAFARNDDIPDQSWIAVNYEGQDGWVIESALIVVDGSLADLPQSSRTFVLD